MAIKQQIGELIRLRYPDECMIAGDVIVDNLIEEYLKGTPDAGENYRDTDDGFNFSVYDLAVLIFAGIQAMAALTDMINQMIDRYKSRIDERKQIHDTVMDALLEAGISREDAEMYCQKYLK